MKMNIEKRIAKVLPTLFACLVMILTAFFAANSPAGNTAQSTTVTVHLGTVQSANIPPQMSLPYLESSPLVTVSDTEPGAGAAGATNLGPEPVSSMHVLMTLGYSNQGDLNNLLTSISNPSSPLYHHYLTATQFNSEFSPSSSTYESVLSYVSSFGVSNLTTFADRTTIVFDASSTVVAAMFHTEISKFRLGNVVYYAPSAPPQLPSPIASVVSAVEGLSSYASARAFIGSEFAPLHSLPMVPVSLRPAAGYLPPATYNGAQLEYGPDMEVTYDEQSLFSEYGYPTDQVVATILWAGSYGGGLAGYCASLTTGTAVGPFVLSDVYAYYNETVPTGVPHAHITAVPINSAAKPSKQASCDTTDATLENTLDLEMVGSLAPGSSIYNVYGPTGSFANLDQAFATILSPGVGVPAALDNVSVISNSWGATDQNDTSWFADLEQAQARGITVLACSGDSGDDPSTTWTVGDVFYPASMAYNAFGDTAVGGTTIQVGATSGAAFYLQIEANPAWYDKPVHWGSSGGVSTVFPEPAYQLSSLANNVIGSKGRGDPDLGAIANNTLITWTYNGFQYIATNASGSGTFEWAYGTSIATPVEAGIVAEMDHVLKRNSQGNLGYLNPELYQLADSEYTTCTYPTSSTTGCMTTGSYSSMLPTTPLIDSATGANYAYSALTGYDLVTGWGSIDAYNYTMYFLNTNSAGILGRFSGVGDMLNLTKLRVTSPSVSYNASVQQNFFLANSMGAPVYWVQNVIYFIFTPTGWEMNFTGWVIFPFYGIYPYATCYEYNWPLVGATQRVPLAFNLTTILHQGTGFDDQSVTFAFGDGQPSISVPTPGGSYIIGSLFYNYSWQGTNYSNGPFPNNPVPGGLSPQLGIVGGPSGGNGTYSSPTAGTMYASVLPWGTSTWIAPSTRKVTPGIDQTGEDSVGLSYTYAGRMGAWTIGTSANSYTQGVLSYDPRTAANYAVNFTETGLPTGTSWSVTLGGITSPTSASKDTFYEPNGLYSYTVGAVSGYTAAPSSGQVTVSGTSPPAIPITFTPTLTLNSVALAPSLANVTTSGKQSFVATPACSAACPALVTYVWSLSASTLGSLNITSGKTVTFTALSAVGTVGIFVNATLNGTTRGNSGVINVTSSASILTSVAVSPVAPKITEGNSQIFTATPTCSKTCPVSGISYVWELTSVTVGTIAGTGASVNFTAAASAAGTVGIYVNATLNGTTQLASTVITVSAPANTLDSVSVSPLSPTIGFGIQATFTATPKCTATCPAGIVYAWSLTKTALGSLSGSGNSIAFTAGTTAVTGGIFVNATLNASVQRASTVITVSGSANSLTSVTLSPLAPDLSLGGHTTFTATPVCTSTCPSGITYIWALTTSTMGSLTGSGASETFTAVNTAGTLGIFVNATLNGTTHGASTTITISSSTIVLESVALSPTAPVVGYGSSTIFTATPTCSGDCPEGITYAWALTGTTLGALSGSGTQVTFNAGTTTGTVGLFLNATLGGITRGSSAVITISTVALSSVTVSPSSASITTSSSQTFTATPVCSSVCPAGITYAWSLTNNLGIINASNTNPILFTAGSVNGTDTLFVNATFGGHSVENSVKITISTNTVTSSGIGSWSLLLLGVIALIVIVAVVVLVTRRKKRSSAPIPPPQYYSQQQPWAPPPSNVVVQGPPPQGWAPPPAGPMTPPSPPPPPGR
jgi:hypothetical protein